jgi:iron uptake system EfeUOB component EfeO/EfeM
MRFQTFFSLSIGLLFLTSCGGNIQEMTDTAQSTIDKAKMETEKATQSAQTKINEAKDTVDKASESANNAVQDVIAIKDGIQGMSVGVSSTLSSVKSGDMAAAQQEFTKIQENWTSLEGTVKSKSAVNYEEINGHMTTLSTLFEANKPDAAQLTTELQALGQSLITTVKQQ